MGGELCGLHTTVARDRLSTVLVTLSDMWLDHPAIACWRFGKGKSAGGGYAPIPRLGP